MKTVDNFNFSGKRALIRVDFNVPLNDTYEITDDTRIRAAIPTIKKIISDGGSVILMSHLGRPKDGPSEKYSLKHIVPFLSKVLNVDVIFANDCIGNDAYEKTTALKPGQIVLLENLRFYKEEEKGDKAFAEKLSKHGDIYVNDAFGTAHRAHASTAVIADFFASDSKCFGYVMTNEIKSITKVVDGAEQPFTAIVGGAKVSDKILIIEQLMNKANNIIIGGGMTYTFLKAMGHNVGKSLCEDDKLDVALSLINKALDKKVNLFLPVDSIIADKFANDAAKKTTDSYAIENDWMGLDIGPKSIIMFKHVIEKSKTILWNGPMGVFEMSEFENGTKQIALSIVEATKKGAYSLIGGGDSVAAINKYHLANDVSYVSTGGGALLEYIEQGTLPGIEAIKK